MKEVTVFTNGDSEKLSTWSNVPYFFTQTLLAKGIRVNRVDLGASAPAGMIFRRTVGQVVKLINKRSSYTYARSSLHFLLGRRKIRRAIRQYPHAEANIFLTFSFSAVGLSRVPSVQFCDWTYDHYLRYFENRPPDWFEGACVRREDRQIEGAEWVFPLFPSVAEEMKSRYQNKNIHYLGNVINSLYDVADDQLSGAKRLAHRLLFVGSKKYLDGATCLIDAYERLRADYPQLSVHIIGMNDADLPRQPEGVHCYGYLDKGKPAERDQYYALLRQATVFVNTTPKWGAFSATIEAMYFGTPVIVSPYDEFTKTFGEAIAFGRYSQNDPVALARAIRDLLTDDAYPEQCRNAHASVQPFTWSAYIDKLLTMIEKPA